MLTLIRVNSNSDWKGRPDVLTTVVGRSDDRAELLKLMDEDVVKWQRDDIVCDVECEVDSAEAEEREPILHNGVWEGSYSGGIGRRWEMDRKPPNELRSFANDDEDGGRGAVTYEILEL